MGTLHGLTLQLFNYTGDREVLKKFEDAQEAWFEGECSYTEPPPYYYLLTAKLNQYRGEAYVSYCIPAGVRNQGCCLRRSGRTLRPPEDPQGRPGRYNSIEHGVRPVLP